MLYEYAVILKEKDKEQKIIVPITAVIADNEAHVKMIATRQISPEHDEHLSSCEVLVRPFR